MHVPASVLNDELTRPTVRVNNLRQFAGFKAIQSGLSELVGSTKSEWLDYQWH